MNSFEVLDLLLFLGIGQGFFLAILFQLIKNKNKAANTILSITLVCASAMLIGRVFFFKSSVLLFFKAALIADLFLYLFGPLLYMYYRRLTFIETPSFTLPFYHFLPSLVFLGYLSWILTYTYEEVNTMYASGTLYWIYLSIEITGLASCFYYGYRCYSVVINYRRAIKNNVAHSPQLISFLIAFLSGLFLFVCLWLINFILHYIFNTHFSYLNYDLIWVAIPIVIYIIGYYGLTQPNILRMPMIKREMTEGVKRIKGTKLQELKDQLNILMIEEQVYLNNDLTLQMLAEQLGETTNNISWLLNREFKKSFYEYVNTYRIKEFVTKIKKEEHHNKTLLALAMEVGFNSKSTFNKAFKTIINDTPSNFIKKL